MLWTFDERGYDPFTALKNLQRDVKHIFNSYDVGDAYPPVNIWSNDEQVIVMVEVPGMDPGDIDISVVQGQLSISGERQIKAPEENVSCHRSEQVEGSFTRTFRLPFDVNNEKVTADYKDGILTVQLPRLEETKPKKIQVKVK